MESLDLKISHGDEAVEGTSRKTTWFDLAQEHLSETDSILQGGIASVTKHKLSDGLDLELQRLAQLTVAVLTRRNRSAPISFIPGEILVRIFTLSSSSPPENIGLPRTSIFPWIIASHVCQRWRYIVLGYATVWAEHVMSFSKESVSQTILHRAGTAPLSLRSPAHMPASFDTVIQHLHRAKRISVYLGTSLDDVNAFFNALCQEASPELEELAIQYSPPHHGNSLPKFFCSMERPFIAPRLRACIFKNCYTPCKTPSSIEELELENRHADASFLPPITHFSEIMRLSARLRRLYISSWMPSVQAEGQGIADLPLLEEIRIYDRSMHHISTLLSLLRFPPTCRVRWRLDFQAADNNRGTLPEYQLALQTIRTLLSCTAAHAGARFRPKWLFLSATRGHRGDIISVDIGADPTLSWRPEHGAFYSLEFPCTHTDTELGELCSFLCDSFQLEEISSLDLWLEREYNDAVWRQIFSVFPHCRSIHLSNRRCNYRRAIRMLQAHTMSPQDGIDAQMVHSSPPFWPILQSLHLFQIDFAVPQAHNGETGASSAALVCQVLSSRAASGYRLQTLEVDKIVPDLTGEFLKGDNDKRVAPVDAYLARIMTLVDELRWQSDPDEIKSAVSSLASPLEVPLCFGKREMIAGTFDLSSQDAVSYDGKVYPTASHLFEAMRFLPHRPDIAESIRMCDSRSTHDAENISFRNDDHVRVDWKQVLIEKKMDEVNYLKFTQNEHAQRTLLMTGHMKLVYYYWKGYSSRNGGAEAGDQLGRSLMRVRDKLRGE